MKKSLLYSLMALVATSASAGSNFPTNGKLAKLTEQYRTKKLETPLVKLHGFDSPAASLAKAKTSTPSSTMEAKTYGFLYDEDGRQSSTSTTRTTNWQVR